LKPHLKKTWCIGKINAQFLAQMERVLWVYSQPYDPTLPVICFDERPCFLIGDVLAPLPLQTGQVAKEHYAYSKHGSCALLGAVEPLTGAFRPSISSQLKSWLLSGNEMPSASSLTGNSPYLPLVTS
jgi:hypothetical protein